MNLYTDFELPIGAGNHELIDENFRRIHYNFH